LYTLSKWDEEIRKIIEPLKIKEKVRKVIDLVRVK